MSTKTTFKRVALVIVATLGFGLLTSVAPASAATSTGIALNTASQTVVGGSSTDTPLAIIKIDVSSVDGTGLATNETITASVTGVPTGVSAKTVFGNAADLRFTEVNQAGNNLVTDWARSAVTTTAAGVTNPCVNLDASSATDGKIGSAGCAYTGMDGADTSSTSTTASTKVESHYIAIFPAFGKDVVDQGAYTITFNHTDSNENLISTTTLKLDFVSTSLLSGAILTLSTLGTFVTGETLGYTSTKYAKLTITNRDAGKIRTKTGSALAPTMSLLDSDGNPAANVAPTNGAANVITAVDDGTAGASGSYGKDFGTYTTAAAFNANNGTYGVTWGAYYTWDTLGNTIKAAYGASTATKAITAYAASSGYTISASASATGAVGSTPTYTVPLTSTSATVTVKVLTGSTAVQDYPVTFTTTWTSCAAGDATPVSGSTGSSVVKTDSAGKATLTVKCGSPSDGTSASVAWTAGASVGTAQVLNWTKSKPFAVSVSPSGPMTVALKAVTTATFTVTDAFSAPVAGTVVNLTVTGSNNTTASPLLIPSATTDAKGQVSYTLTDALAIAAGTDAITATTVDGAKTKTLTLTYATTVPVPAAMKVYYDASETTWTTLVPATTIYETGTTGYTLNQGKNIAKTLIPSSVSASDDVIGFKAYVETAALAAASGLPVSVSISDGGWILSSAGLPGTSRTYYTSSAGYTDLINVTATTPGTKTITFTVGTVTSTASLAFTNGTSGTTGRFVTVTAGTANASAVASGNSYPSFTAKVTDGLGNAVAGAALNIVATGVGRLSTGGKTAQWTTDATGSYTFELVSTEEGAATVTVTATTSGAQHSDIVGYISSTAQSNTALAAGIKSATGTVTFAAGASTTDVAQTAVDAAAEATDAANAATDAANAAAEAADAATAAAQDAADAVAALSAQVATLISGLKSQLTALTNLVIKIQKKVKA
jgi:hypothetical protein